MRQIDLVAGVMFGVGAMVLLGMALVALPVDLQAAALSGLLGGLGAIGACLSFARVR